MRHVSWLLAVVLVVGVTLISAPLASAESVSIETVMVNSEEEPHNSHSLGPPNTIFLPPYRRWVSENGRYLVFEAPATNLHPLDTDERMDVFLRDRVSGVTELVSLRSDGTKVDGNGFVGSMSADARYIAFSFGCDSPGNHIIPSLPCDGYQAVVVRDRIEGVTELVSVDSQGDPAVGGDSGRGGDIAISANGRYVAFMSGAPNLLPSDPVWDSYLFVHDRVSGATLEVAPEVYVVDPDDPLTRGGDVRFFDVDSSGNVYFTKYESFYCPSPCPYGEPNDFHYVEISSVLRFKMGTEDTDTLFFHRDYYFHTFDIDWDEQLIGLRLHDRNQSDASYRFGILDIPTGVVRYVTDFQCAFGALSNQGDQIACQSRGPAPSTAWNILIFGRTTGSEVWVVPDTFTWPDGQYPDISGDGITVGFYSQTHRLAPNDSDGSDLFAAVIEATSPPGPFDDVPADHLFADDVEWLASEGITKGCNPPENTLFCPDDFVTRGQMAAFLVRALGYTEGLGANLFVDDDGNTFENDIDRLGTAGVTKGCNPPVNNGYCPGDFVTRGQMAAFLVRALGYTDDGGGDLFIDDDSSTFESDIDRLGTAGVTKGCNPPVNNEFCPNDLVTRAQMAAFLHRALGG